MRRPLALAATLSLLALAPALAQQMNAPVPAQTSPRLYPRGPATTYSTTPPTTTGMSPGMSSGTMSRRNAAQPAPNGQLVNINTASPAELDALPQIGKARLKKIIDNRPYRSTDELLTKRVVSQRVYDMIKDRITVR
ncbi:MAG: helix-hairpin-helix domain-containing protein [Acetobacteraceae bacterium]|nr:helix-hairpin-helix domain-containing protein [Acetobacteraceae bacterium]